MCRGHTQDVKSVTWHPSDELLVSTGYDDAIRAWGATGDDDWKVASVVQNAHRGTIWQASFNAVGDELGNARGACGHRSTPYPFSKLILCVVFFFSSYMQR